MFGTDDFKLELEQADGGDELKVFTADGKPSHMGAVFETLFKAYDKEAQEISPTVAKSVAACSTAQLENRHNLCHIGMALTFSALYFDGLKLGVVLKHLSQYGDVLKKAVEGEQK